LSSPNTNALQAMVIANAAKPVGETATGDTAADDADE
jgi:hypothetical protein